MIVFNVLFLQNRKIYLYQQISYRLTIFFIGKIMKKALELLEISIIDILMCKIVFFCTMGDSKTLTF